MFRPFNGQYDAPFDTKCIDMIALTRGIRHQWHLFCSASRTRLCNHLPKYYFVLIEQCIELFGNLRELFTPHGNNYCAFVFESRKTKFGRIVRNDSKKKLTTSGLFFFLKSDISCIRDCQSWRKNQEKW